MGGTDGTGGGGEIVSPGLLFVGEVGGNLNALFIVPVRARAAAAAALFRPDGVVGDSSPSSSLSLSSFVVDVELGRAGTVGSAELGSEPSAMKVVLVGGVPDEGLRGKDFAGVNGAGAADEVRRDGVEAEVAVVGDDGGRGGCGCESCR